MEITFNMTNICNLKCSYCIFVWLASDAPIKTKLISSINELINFYTSRWELTSFTFAGWWEPTLFFDEIEAIFENLDLKHPELAHFYIITNGVWYSQRISNLVNKFNIFLVLSLDGIKEEHDKNRVLNNGNGSFDLIMKNKDILFPDVTDVNYTIYYNNFEKFLEWVQFISKNIPKLRRLNFNFVFNHDKWDKELLWSLRKKLLEFLAWYIREKKFLKFETNLRNYAYVWGADFDSACLSHLYLDKDGKIFKCWAYKFIEKNFELLWNLYDDKISDIEDKRSKMRWCWTKCSRGEFEVFNNLLKNNVLKDVGQKYQLIDGYIPAIARKPIY